jgi:plastocyanin
MLHSHVDTHAVLLPQDILDVLSAFGGSDPAADITDDGTVNVNDLLGLLSKFGAECTVAGGDGGGGSTIDVDWIIKAYEPMTAAVGDTVTFTYSDYHNVFLQSGAAGQAPCDPGGATQVGGNTDSPASFTFTEAGAYTVGSSVPVSSFHRHFTAH